MEQCNVLLKVINALAGSVDIINKKQDLSSADKFIISKLSVLSESYIYNFDNNKLNKSCSNLIPSINKIDNKIVNYLNNKIHI